MQRTDIASTNSFLEWLYTRVVQKKVSFNSISVLIIINTACFFIPSGLSEYVQPSTVNYCWLIVVILLSILNTKVLLSTIIYGQKIAILIVSFYAFIGLALGLVHGHDQIDSLKKFLVICATAYAYIIVICPKINHWYIKSVLRTALLCSFIIMLFASLSIFYEINWYAVNPVNYLSYTSENFISSHQYSFNGYNSSNIYFVIGMLMTLGLAYLVANRSRAVKLTSCFCVLMYWYIFWNNPLRVLLYFALPQIIVCLALIRAPVRYAVAALAFVFSSALYIFADKSWQLEYIVNKSVNEGRVKWIDNYINFVDINGLMNGFAALGRWTSTFPYSPLDVNTIFIFILELGIFGVLLYILIFYISVRFAASKKMNNSDRLLQALGIVSCSIILSPSAATFAQTSSIQYYVCWFYIATIIRYTNNILNMRCVKLDIST